METTIKSGKIQCKLHGSITAIDCDLLQNKVCVGCFIYTALKDMSIDLSEFSTPEFENLKEINKAVN